MSRQYREQLAAATRKAIEREIAELTANRQWTVDEYIREEVRRQGHDLANPADGGLRVAWMRQAWDYAIELSDSKIVYPNLEHVLEIARLVEQVKNADGFRRVGVRVGTRICPPPDQVPFLVERLVEQGTQLTALEWYYEYEMIHGFVDGNGRSGKVVYSLIGGTLNAPIFPPHCLFGEWIENP